MVISDTTSESKQKPYIECSFCFVLLEPRLAKMKCPECHAQFEWNDWLECVFVDFDDMRLTADAAFNIEHEYGKTLA